LHALGCLMPEFSKGGRRVAICEHWFDSRLIAMKESRGVCASKGA